jgi:hypothetical protein
MSIYQTGMLVPSLGQTDHRMSHRLSYDTTNLRHKQSFIVARNQYGLNDNYPDHITILREL